jgi:hypothetical protein
VSFIRKDNKPINGILLSLSFFLIAVAVFIKSMDSNTEMLWVFIPITLLGTLFLYENLYTLNNRHNVFSALSLFLAFGFVFFFIVPLNQVIWDYWPSIPPDADMVHWAGVWSLLCFVGFFLFAFGYKVITVNNTRRITSSINTKKMHKPFLIGLAICLLAQAIVLIKLGGISGYLNAYEIRLEGSIQSFNPYKGLGFLFTFSESFPNLLAIYLILLIKDAPWAKTYKVLFILIVFLFVTNMLFGGLRGSRSTTIWSMFWFLVLYQNNIKQLSLKMLGGLAFGFFIFMTTYSLFKFGGIEGIQGIWDPEVKAEVYKHKHIKDADKFALVRDSGRTDVQSYILKTYWNDEYPMSYGRTLFAGALSFVPSFILPNKPYTAVKEKTGIFRGNLSFSATNYTTLRAGGYGEYIINFGVFGGLVFFLLIGASIGAIDGFSKKFSKGGTYNLIAPILALLSIQFLMSDSNVISQFLFRFLTVPLLVLYFCPKLITSNSKNTSN